MESPQKGQLKSQVVGVSLLKFLSLTDRIERYF